MKESYTEVLIITKSSNKQYCHMPRLNITDNAFLLLFFSLSIILSIIFLVLGLTIYMEYNLAIGLFTSFLTTAFTVLFLNIFQNYRKQKQWQKVKENAYFEISTELSSIFSEVIELVEGEFNATSFKLTLNGTTDKDTKSKLIYSKLKQYNEDKEFKLAVNHLNPLTNKVFYDARTNLYSIHLVYGNLIDNPTIVNDIIKIRNMLRCFELMEESEKAFQKVVNENKALMTIAQKLLPPDKQIDLDSFSLSKIAMAPQTQKLVELIFDLWNFGVKFCTV